MPNACIFYIKQHVFYSGVLYFPHHGCVLHFSLNGEMCSREKNFNISRQSIRLALPTTQIFSTTFNISQNKTILGHRTTLITSKMIHYVSAFKQAPTLIISVSSKRMEVLICRYSQASHGTNRNLFLQFFGLRGLLTFPSWLPS